MILATNKEVRGTLSANLHDLLMVTMSHPNSELIKYGIYFSHRKRSSARRSPLQSSI